MNSSSPETLILPFEGKSDPKPKPSLFKSVLYGEADLPTNNLIMSCTLAVCTTMIVETVLFAVAINSLAQTVATVTVAVYG